MPSRNGRRSSPMPDEIDELLEVDDPEGEVVVLDLIAD
jgi:hypothetical protein